jgi:hypothetical protein
VKHEVAVVPLQPVRLRGKSDELRVYNAVGLRNREWRGEETKPG